MSHELDIIPGSEWGFFTLPRPMCIAGPCSAETEEQVMETARGITSFGIHVFRAGIWKPRTHPGSFEGVGTPGLKWLRRVKEELGMKVCTEVATEKHVLECIKYGVDIVWIGARTSDGQLCQGELELFRDILFSAVKVAGIKTAIIKALRQSRPASIATSSNANIGLSM